MEENIRIRLQAFIRKVLLEEIGFEERLEYNIYTMLQIDADKKLPIVIEDYAIKSKVQEELSTLKQSELFAVIQSAELSSLKKLGLAPFPRSEVDVSVQTDANILEETDKKLRTLIDCVKSDISVQTDPMPSQETSESIRTCGIDMSVQTEFSREFQDVGNNSDEELTLSDNESVPVETSRAKSRSTVSKPALVPLTKRLTVDLVPIEIKQEQDDSDYEPPANLSEDDSETEGVVVVPELPPDDEQQPKSNKHEEIACPLCPTSFRSQQGAEKHLRVKHDIGNVYICKICQDICPSNTAMHEHMKNKHGTDSGESTESSAGSPKKRGRKPLPRNLKKAKVPSIQKSVPTRTPRVKIKPIRPPAKLKKKAVAHRTATKVAEKLDCKECSKSYQSSRALRRHVATVHQLSKHECNICGKEFTSKETLYHHKRGIHSQRKPYNCEECGATFNFNHSLRLHRLKHSGKRPHQCPQCDKTYLTSNHLKMHMEGVHGSKKNYSCRFCGKCFSYTTSLRVHEMTHDNIRPYKCQVCGQGFVNSHSLKYHTESKHALNTWFKCDICNKSYKTEFLMKTHRRRHTADGSRYMCDICGRQFMYKSTLEIHAAVHSEEKLYQCSTCGKSFKTYATLYSHQYVHKTDSPHNCPDCGKAFKTKERCKAHQKRHSGLKPHECDICGRCFPDKGGLSKHKKTVHCTEKRFVCNYCGKACSRADNLRVHMKIHDKTGASQSELGMTDRKAQQSASIEARPQLGRSEQMEAVNSLNRMETDLDRITASVGYDRLVDTVMDRSVDKRLESKMSAGYTIGSGIQHGNHPPPSNTPGGDSMITNISSPSGAISPPLTRVYPDSHAPYIQAPDPDCHVVPLPIPLTQQDSSHIGSGSGDHNSSQHNVVAPLAPSSIALPLPPSSTQLSQMTSAAPYMYMWQYMHHSGPNTSQSHEGNNYY